MSSLVSEQRQEKNPERSFSDLLTVLPEVHLERLSALYLDCYFFCLVIFLYKNVIRKQLKRDRTQNVESYSFLLKALLLTAIPVVFSTAVYNINQIIDLTIFNHVMESQGYVEKEYMALQGIYTGKYDTLINVPMGNCERTWNISCAKSYSCCYSRYKETGSQ